MKPSKRLRYCFPIIERKSQAHFLFIREISNEYGSADDLTVRGGRYGFELNGCLWRDFPWYLRCLNSKCSLTDTFLEFGLGTEIVERYFCVYFIGSFCGEEKAYCF